MALDDRLADEDRVRLSLEAERKSPGFTSVSRRPISAVTGIGPIIGLTAVFLKTCIPLHAARRPSDHGGTSCRQTASGSPAVISRTISSTYRLRPGGFVLPWNRFQVRMTTRLAYEAVARCHRFDRSFQTDGQAKPS